MSTKQKPRNEQRSSKANPKRKVHAHLWIMNIIKPSTSYFLQRVENESRYYCECGETSKTGK